jgi:hypothetical protein
MSDETTPQTSPETATATEEVRSTDIEAASEQLAALGEGWNNLPPRDPETGKFVKKEEAPVEAEAPQVEAAPDVAQEPEAEPEPEQATEPEAEPEPEFKVVLKGHADRGEDDLELVLPDAEAVERFNRAVNDGLRKKDYEAKLQTVAQKEAEVAEFFTALEHNPIGTVINAIPREASLDVARALVAEHWDALFPELQQFSQDPTRVRETKLDARERAMQADQQARSVVQANQRAAAILSATEALVPDRVAPEIRTRFLRDAERDLIDAAQRGVAISPDTVQTLLHDRIAMYGFGQDPVKPVKPVVAKRVGQSNPPATTPDVDKAKQVQARLVQTAQARKAAAALPPAGRGAVAVRAPLVPKGADIEAASEHLAKADSWAAFRPT